MYMYMYVAQQLGENSHIGGSWGGKVIKTCYNCISVWGNLFIMWPSFSVVVIWRPYSSLKTSLSLFGLQITTTPSTGHIIVINEGVLDLHVLIRFPPHICTSYLHLVFTLSFPNSQITISQTQICIFHEMGTMLIGRWELVICGLGNSNVEMRTSEKFLFASYKSEEVWELWYCTMPCTSASVVDDMLCLHS